VASRLMRRDILRCDEATRLRFRHPLVGRVAYQGLALCARTHGHRRALAALTRRRAPAADRAVHVERSIGLFEDSDLDVLVDATSLLLVELAHLRSAGEPAELVPLLVRRAVVGLFDGELPDDDQVALASRVAERGGDAVTRLGALALSGLCAAHTGDVTQAT